MPGIPSLQAMIARELARRQEGEGLYPPFSFIVSNEKNAMTDAAAAAKEIIEDVGKGLGVDRVNIAPSIYDAVVAALRVNPSAQAYSQQGDCRLDDEPRPPT